jgi:hypothetical protein
MTEVQGDECKRTTDEVSRTSSSDVEPFVKLLGFNYASAITMQQTLPEVEGVFLVRFKPNVMALVLLI